MLPGHSWRFGNIASDAFGFSVSSRIVHTCPPGPLVAPACSSLCSSFPCYLPPCPAACVRAVPVTGCGDRAPDMRVSGFCPPPKKSTKTDWQVSALR